MDNIGSASADVEAWTLVSCLDEGGFLALFWETLKDFGYTAYPEYSTCKIMTTGQRLCCGVKVKVLMCPTNLAWEEWECKAQGLNLVGTVQKASLEALTTFCGKHSDTVADAAAKVIPVPGRHTGPRVEREAFLSAQDTSHYSPDLVTSLRFSEAMYDIS
jgi:predicted TIM-barrel enzyme